MQNKILIKEIFESIQGEGPYIGYNQLFIRFSTCNLNCKYCDTDFKSNIKEYTKEELLKEISLHKNIHSVSLTGGEPLTEADFLSGLLKNIDKKIYLETNGTLYKELKTVINYIDIISADVKLNSSSLNGYLFELHEKFVDIAIKNKKEIFLKAVFNDNITNEEINDTIKLAQKNNLLIVLQPQTEKDKIIIGHETMINIFNKFVEKYDNVRLIPQTHKFINVR